MSKTRRFKIPKQPRLIFSKLSIGWQILSMAAVFLLALFIILILVAFQTNGMLQIAAASGDAVPAEVLAALRTRFRTLLITASIALFAMTTLSLVMGYWLMQSIMSPIEILTESADRWAQGRFDHRVELDRRDEFGALGHSLNRSAERQASWSKIMEKSITGRSKELEHRTVHLETSVAIAQRITSILDQQTLLNQVTEIIRQRYDLQYVGIFLPNRDNRSLALKASTREGRPANGTRPDSEIILPVEEHSLVGWVALHRRAGMAHNQLNQFVGSSYAHQKQGQTVQAELALPLTIGRELVGVLDLQSSREDMFRSEDLPMFQSLADQVAIAIRNASVYEAEQIQRQLAETLQQVGQELNSTLNPSAVLNLVLKHTQAIIDFEQAAVLLIEQDRLEYGAVLYRHDAISSQMVTLSPVTRQPSGVVEELIANMTPTIIKDIAAETDWEPAPGFPSKGSWMGVPLITDGESSGLLVLTRPEPNTFIDQELANATAIAAQASVSLENARLYDRIKQFSEQLEYEVKRRTEALQRAYSELEKLDTAKTNFISIASHELRTPLTVLIGNSQILKNDPEIQQNPHQTELLNGIISKTKRLKEIIDTMLDMARIDDRSLTIAPEPLSIQEIYEEIMRDLQEAIAERDLNIQLSEGFEALPTVFLDYDGIRKILYHLIINAIKYTPDGGKISIDGRAWFSSPPKNSWPEKGVEITVKDTGIGIEPENLNAIFTKFYQTGQVALHSSGKTKFKGGGPGLGLAIVKGMVDAHGGHVWAQSEGHDEIRFPGSTFHVILPLMQSVG